MLATFGLIAAVTLGPVVVHDSRETSPLGLGRPGRGPSRPSLWCTNGASANGASGGWGSPQNDQDRGIVRTGRHAGDWELIQVR